MIRGQGAEDVAAVITQARALRLHHGVVLEGPRGCGKSAAAWYIAQALLCPGSDRLQPCTICLTCRKIVASNHPDVHLLSVPEDKLEIPVDLVRELQSTLLQLPVEGRARVAIVDPADALNEQGQNALLKTLEEPGRDTWILLATARPEGLLPTVRSRVARLRLAPLPRAEIVQALAAEGRGDEASRQWAADLCRGSLGLAQRLLAGPEPAALWQECVQLLRDANASPVQAGRAMLQGAGTRRDSEQRARMALWMLRHLVRAELLSMLASSEAAPYGFRTSERWTALLDALLEAETDLDLHMAPEQVLIGALLRFAAGGAARVSALR